MIDQPHTRSDRAAQQDGTAAPPRSMLREWRDAVTPRAVGLVIGVLVLQLAFILSYAGAFHSPSPHLIPVGVVAPQGTPPAAVGGPSRRSTRCPAGRCGPARCPIAPRR